MADTTAEFARMRLELVGDVSADRAERRGSMAWARDLSETRRCQCARTQRRPEGPAP